MGRYRNEFGSILNVDDDTAARQGDRWTAVEVEPKAKPAARTTKKSDDK